MFFKMSLAMLGTTIFLQLWVVCGQNYKTGLKRVVPEMISVVLGVKPVVDAIRVVRGSKAEEGQLVDPLIEMTFSKGIGEFFVL